MLMVLWLPFLHFINNDLEYLRDCESSNAKYSTSVRRPWLQFYGHIKWIGRLRPNQCGVQMTVKIRQIRLWGISHWGKKRRQFYAFADHKGNQFRTFQDMMIWASSRARKVTNLHNEERIAFIVILKNVHIEAVVILRRVEVLQWV
ncbi:hypothetical protein Tco_0463094 [Tanacetum coccineum]|uniref:Uncharacterized protein n=1 Tax=Tanacetum coccineum TaxID=301880 RepID=A0ABQ5F592_9ASTR